MPRYEFVEGSSAKFWEVELHGVSFTARWGRLGTDGQSKTQTFANAETAEHECELLIRSKENKGYRLVTATAGADEVDHLVVRLDDGQGWWRELELRGSKLAQRARSSDDEPNESSTRFDNVSEAKDQFDFIISRYLKQGYTELSRGSARVPREEAPSAVEEKIAAHPQYEAACLAAPDDRRPWQIYADWLQERGDPRGELAALFLGGKAAAAWERLKRQREALLGPHSERELLDFVVTNGFLSGATLKCADFDSDTELADLTADFLSRGAARFVSQLRFGLASYESDNDWSGTVNAVLEAPQARHLRKLEFDHYTYEDCEISWTPYGDFSAVWAGLPELLHLHVRAGGAGTLGRIEHARLETFIRESGGLPRAEVEVIVQAKWPALERLDLWTGSGNYGGNSTTDQLESLFHGRDVPRLVHLGLINSELSVEVVKALAKSPLLPRLRVLDLSKGVLTDDDVDLLARLAPKFAHLQRIDLSENLFEERLDELRRAFPRAALEDQRENHGDEDDRYVAIGE